MGFGRGRKPHYEEQEEMVTVSKRMLREMVMEMANKQEGPSGSGTAARNGSPMDRPTPEVIALAKLFQRYCKYQRTSKNWFLGMPASQASLLLSWVESLKLPGDDSEFQTEIRQKVDSLREDTVDAVRSYASTKSREMQDSIFQSDVENREPAIAIAVHRLKKEFENQPDDFEGMIRTLLASPPCPELGRQSEQQPHGSSWE